MPLLFGHRGDSLKHLENSLEAFRAALDAGMDGVELDVQPTRDGVCMVLHDETLDRTTEGRGSLRQAKVAELPRLRNGEPIPRLADVLELPLRHLVVELKGEPGWKQALAAVEAAEATDRVIFASFEHSEVLQLWHACPEARCAFLWAAEEALALTDEELDDLPETLFLLVPLNAVLPRLDLWRPRAARLMVWGLKTPAEADTIPFEVYALIADGPR